MMKMYSIVKYLSSKRVGDLSPMPKMNERLQLYFDFYNDDNLSMGCEKKLRKKKRSGNNDGIPKKTGGK